MTYSKQFEQFWQLYPGRTNKCSRIVKQDKLGAFREWQKLTEDEREMAMSGHPEQGEYTPDARKWLKHKRWEDEDVTNRAVEHKALRKKANQRESASAWILQQTDEVLQKFIGRRPTFEWLVRELRPEIFGKGGRA